VLATADDVGTNEIIELTGMSKPTAWRWRERYLDGSLPRLKREKTPLSRVSPIPREIRLECERCADHTVTA
jgi:hypothetical protein